MTVSFKVFGLEGQGLYKFGWVSYEVRRTFRLRAQPFMRVEYKGICNKDRTPVQLQESH